MCVYIVCVCVFIIPQHRPDPHVIPQTGRPDTGSPGTHGDILRLGLRVGGNQFPFKSNLLSNIDTSCIQENRLLLQQSTDLFDGHCFMHKTEPRAPSSV